MTVLTRLTGKFNSHYGEKPVTTTMITNAILGGVADTVAQLVTAYRARLTNRVDAEINAHESNKEMLPPFCFERLARFMSYGFLMAPIQLLWFRFLSRAFPLTKMSPTFPALKRVACDQSIFAPFGLVCFFSFMTIAEGGDRRTLTRKLQDVYLPTLKANLGLWPAVQALNFRVVPVKFQVPFVSSVGVAWTAYLSLINASQED